MDVWCDVSGDCSLTINNVDADIDEGDWQCGVTSSNVTLQDSLVSQPATLAVKGQLNNFPMFSSSSLVTNSDIGNASMS